VVVTISAWIYIASALLGIFQLSRIHATAEQIVAVIGLVACLAVGVGLLMRSNWARWIALGMSLLTWTVGSLVLIWGIVKLLSWFAQPKGLPSFGFVVLLFIWGMFAALIWLSFRLFEHLNSVEGREDFNTPETETHAVAKSTAAYVAWCVVGVFVARPDLVGAGSSSSKDLSHGWTREDQGPDKIKEFAPAENQRATARAGQGAEQAAADSVRAIARQEEALVRERAARDPKVIAQREYSNRARELLARRERDPSYSDAQFKADLKAVELEYQQWRESSAPRTSSEAPPPPAASSERPASAVLKCRDSSGAISYTQGYCPAGTNLVESLSTD